VVPASDRLGAVGEGWRVAMTTLMNERVAIGRRGSRRGEGAIGTAVEEFRAAVAAGRAEPSELASARDRLLRLWTQAETARLTNARAAAQRGAGAVPGPEGSIAKLRMAELNKAIYELCVDLRGTDGMRIDSYEMSRLDRSTSGGSVDVRRAFLRSLANSIEGGTSEVMRNILGERVLGLPGEPRVDRDRAWKDVPR
jgi:alkylation response protein AidB-like acyl-CoA dehydrogenase